MNADSLAAFAGLNNANKILSALYVSETALSYKELTEKTLLPEKSVSSSLSRDISKELIVESKTDVKRFSLSARGKNLVEHAIKSHEEKMTERVLAVDHASTIEAAKLYVEKKNDDVLAALRSDYKVVKIDFRSLAAFSPELASRLLDDSYNTIKSFDVAASVLCEVPGSDVSTADLHFCFDNLPDSQWIAIRELDHKYVNKLIIIEGITKTIYNKQSCIVSTKYECPSCGSIIPVLHNDEVYREPTRCECGRKGFFRAISHHKEPFQVIKIEEVVDQLNVNQQPRTVYVRLLGEALTHRNIEAQLSQGSRIKIVGTVNLKDKYIRNQKSVYQEPFVEANNIEFLQGDFKEIAITKDDEEEFVEFAKKCLSDFEGVLDDVSHSFAPFIFGESWMIRSIILQMHAAPNTVAADGRTVVRNMFHTLLLGDPGTGKSEVILQVLQFMPRARFASCESSSGVGLTASVTRDELTGEWGIEAGVIPLANNSIAILDEIDKMEPEEINRLHTAMSKNTVDVNKAGVHGTLRAETCILAAGNPKHSRFDDYTPLTEQFNISSTILNRFGIIIAIKDKVNVERDTNIARLVGRRMTGEKSIYEIKYTKEFLRKKIIYTKTKVGDIKFSAEADALLQNWYPITRTSRADKVVPVNARPLEDAYRISLAVARFRLASLTDNKVSKSDAEFALKLLENTTLKVLQDNTGGLDSDAMEGMPSSRKDLFRTIGDAVQEIDRLNNGRGADEGVLAKRLEEKGITEERLQEALETMERKGDIFRSKPGYVKRNR